MNAKELREKFQAFFETKMHKRIPSSSLIPENDPTVLFTTAGMHPLVPFLLGQSHPLGTRLVDVQKCIRTQDIEEVGDTVHHTFFEMLGNWSLGDYFKKEAIEWSWEFLTSKEWLGLDKHRIAISCFAGDTDAPKDVESAEMWKSLGVPEERIAFLPKKNNWWGPAGETGPCGPDTEIFYWASEEDPPKSFNDDTDTWVEIWNNVFMQYNKTKDGTYEELSQKNVDTGMGLERTLAVLNNLDDNYKTELFSPIIKKIEELSGKSYTTYTKEMRVIADHLRAATFIIGDPRGIFPSNTGQGYVLRRLIRRAIRYIRMLGIQTFVCADIARTIISLYTYYSELLERKSVIIETLDAEEAKFSKTLEKGLFELKKIEEKLAKGDFYRQHQRVPTNNELREFISKGLFKEIKLTGKHVFDLFQSHGLPPEMTIEELEQNESSKVVDKNTIMSDFKCLLEKHQELSRTASAGAFKSGLADNSEKTTRLHTATHLLNEALRKVLHEDIRQRGSNINPERLRFDFNFDRKLTPEEVKAVEAEVNRVIQEGLFVETFETTPDDAKAQGAQAEFGMKYPEKVSVYKIGAYSMEICTGPHVKNTKDIGTFKILKEESSAAGIRRIKATVL